MERAHREYVLRKQDEWLAGWTVASPETLTRFQHQQFVEWADYVAADLDWRNLCFSDSDLD